MNLNKLLSAYLKQTVTVGGGICTTSGKYLHQQPKRTQRVCRYLRRQVYNIFRALQWVTTKREINFLPAEYYY